MLIQFTIRGDADKAKDKVAPILAAVSGIQAGYPAFTIREVGVASANYELGKQFNKDFANAERLTIPITLAILLCAFGALVAAGLPVLLAFSAVLASLGLFAGITHVYPADYQSTSSVILLIGMAVGVDYSLFYLRREREERALGNEPRRSLLRAASTSGQAVLISGATVLIAMAGMFIAGSRIFTGMALGTMLVVLCAVIGSVTVLPAMLSKLGDRVEWGRVPYFGRRKHSASESRFWGFVLDRVLRRPGRQRLRSRRACLLVLAAPALSMHTKLPSFTDMPPGLQTVKTYKAVIKAFPGAPTPAQVVIQAPDVRAPAVSAAIRNLERRAVASGQMFQPMLVSISPNHRVAEVQIPRGGQRRRLHVARGAERPCGRRSCPRRSARSPGVEYAVAGETAGTHDFNELMKSRMLSGAAVRARARLLPAARDVPLDRHPGDGDRAQPALGRRRLRPARARLPAHLGAGDPRLHLEPFDHLMAADVHVRRPVRSLDGLPRVHPEPDQGAARRRAHDRGGGLARDPADGGTVTSAAIIMVAVFSIFGTLQLIMMKQLGVGLAIAVLIDATIIRGVLLPATMKLLGDWNWYMPRSLDWVPRLSPDSEPATAPRRPTATDPGRRAA